MSTIRTRQELQQRFTTGSTPTQTDFEDLFATCFNQSDDGVKKGIDTGLQVQAAVNGSQPDLKDLLLFYEDFGIADPDWSLRLRSEGTNWGIELGRVGNSDFLISNGGNIGMGTNTPSYKLDVVGNVRFSNNLVVSNDVTTETLTVNETSTLNTVDISGALSVGPSGNRLIVNTDGSVGVGTTAVAAGFKMDVDGSGKFRQNLIVSSQLGIGISSPTAPLSFANTTGSKISFFESSGTHYGIGVINQTLQLYTANSGDSIVFGYGSSGTFTEKMRIKGNGNVGIGTNSPGSKLDVNGSVNFDSTLHANGATTLGSTLTVTGKTSLSTLNVGSSSTYAPLTVIGGTSHSYTSNYNVLRTQDNAHDYNSTTLSFSIGIHTNDCVNCATVVVSSDQRIKNVLGVSDAPLDLQTLMGIEVSNYKMKDHLKFGNKVIKKVIAQQVDEVYPEAVAKVTDVVPDIMQTAKVDQGWIALDTDLQVEERVKLISEDHMGIYVVKAIKDNAFRVTIAEDIKEVFVYGREVDDFQIVDYDAIAMLNVSATQELYRQLQQLQKRIATLEQPALA